MTHAFGGTFLTWQDLARARADHCSCAADRGSQDSMYPLWALLVVAVVAASSAEPFQYDKHALANAAEKGDVDALVALIANGAEVNEKDRAGRTALHHAAAQGHVNVLQTLLERGADIEARTSTGYTALHDASVHDQLESAKVLLDYGADKDAKTSGGHGVLSFAKDIQFREHFKKHTDL